MDDEYVPLWYFNGYKGWVISDEGTIDFMGTVNKKLFKQLLDGEDIKPLVDFPSYIKYNEDWMSLLKKWEDDNIDHQKEYIMAVIKPSFWKKETFYVEKEDTFIKQFNDGVEREYSTEKKPDQKYMNSIIRESLVNHTIDKDDELEQIYLEEFENRNRS